MNLLKLVSVIAYIFVFSSIAMAYDTDIYKQDVSNNCYILMDNSGSTDFGVYQHTVDYGDMFDYLYCLDSSGGQTACGNEYAYDTVNDSSYFYENHYPKSKIYLVKGNVGVKIASVDGEQVAFTGDPADPEYLWYTNNMIDTHTYIDKSGNLSAEEGKTQRLTVNDDGLILLDGVALPLGQSIKLHDKVTLEDGTQVDRGFGGMINAPGYYFSGLEGVGGDSSSHNVAEDGDSEVYFFISGNWMNMQTVYNLHYVDKPTPNNAKKGDPAWKYEEIPISSSSWSIVEKNLKYPDDGDPSLSHSGAGSCPVNDQYCVYKNSEVITYENGLTETETQRTLNFPGAKQIQVHFSMFDVEGDGNSDSFDYDYVVLKNNSGNVVAKYDNDNNPEGDWSATVSGDSITIALYSDNYRHMKGYEIDKARVTYHVDAYKMQRRIDVAKDAMLFVLDEFRGQINWGFGKFNYTGTTADGAKLGHSLNPSLSDDEVNNSIRTAIENVSPQYGTPLGEALQDIFLDGYYGKRNSLSKILCRKNYIIVMTDGFPSGDNDWSRINKGSNPVFTDADNDGWTQDPYQYNYPPDDYYDDVAHWMYTHSWVDDDMAEILDPEGSYENIITHHISFTMNHPLLQDAAGESGGEYISAYNKSQLISAFYSLGLQMTEAISFTAPVVSVDEYNKVESGDDLYMAQFLPQSGKNWIGNLKKFQFGDGSDDRPDKWMIYDAASNEAIDFEGKFLDNTVGFWGDEDDANDFDHDNIADIKEDGVGEVLTETVNENYQSGEYYNRNIYYYNSTSSVLESFTRNLSPGIFSLDSDDIATRDSIVNFVYGYNFNATALGSPTGPRPWALGDIIHSRPAVIDYYDSDGSVEKRYVAVGANDGMLHVFNDADGSEAWAFIPDAVLGKLKQFETDNHLELVDGEITLVRQENASNPKYLIFGLRRGGDSYYCIDISDSDSSNWTLKWKFDDAELGQTWSSVQTANINIGNGTYKRVAIFNGGYDQVEDNFPEPFVDSDSDGQMDSNEWSKNDSDQDINDNDEYDYYNPDKDTKGRAIYIVDLDDPIDTSSGVLPFTLKYGATDVTTGRTQTLKNLKYCFPSSPSVIRDAVFNDSGELEATYVFERLYSVDIYGNLYKVSYDPGGSTPWQVKHVFSANPASSCGSGEWGNCVKASDDSAWRKVFYGPAVSSGGSGYYFDRKNFYASGININGTSDIATLFFGTGDRVHPNYSMRDNRVYAVYDDTSLGCLYSGSVYTISGAPYYEKDLLNLTCDELDEDVDISSSFTYTKTELDDILVDDIKDENGVLEFISSGNENDSKGWYIVFSKQKDDAYCSHCSYVNTDPEDHSGEKMLSRINLFNDALYFTTYKHIYDDPCNPQGNAFSYALNYAKGTSYYNYSSDDEAQDISDRYIEHLNVKGIPSGFEIVVRDGEAGAMASIGDKIAGGGVNGTFGLPDAKSFSIKFWKQN